MQKELQEIEQQIVQLETLIDELQDASIRYYQSVVEFGATLEQCKELFD
jgi:uncharacterized coiled-coil DUF342 family protein